MLIGHILEPYSPVHINEIDGYIEAVILRGEFMMIYSSPLSVHQMLRALEWEYTREMVVTFEFQWLTPSEKWTIFEALIDEFDLQHVSAVTKNRS